MASPVFSCFKCGEVVPLGSGSKVGRREACPRCSADLHCCLNCTFYDPHAHNQCRETQAEWVRYKEEANYCDYFRPLLAEGRGAAGKASSSAEEVRKKLDNLFKI